MIRKLIKRHPRASLVVALALLIGGQAIGLLPIAQASRVLTRPLSVPFTKLGLGINGWVGDILHLPSLSNENDELRTANTELRAQLAGLRGLDEVNNQLRAQLDFGSKNHLQSTGADVIAYQPDDIRQAILINKGSNDGLRANQAVMAGGYLIGVIKDVFHSTSQVILINDPDFRALATTEASQAPGIVKGLASSNIAMERIPQNHVVQIGETVITSGLDGAFAIGLPIGEVVEVAASAEAIFQTARLMSPINLNGLRVVSVLTGN